MLVDDEEMTRDGLKEYVSWAELGMEVVGTAEDGKQALERFAELRPDLLLCDVRMPHMDGLELARRLKEQGPDCKIIFLSGYSDVEYLKSAIKLQAVDYVEKPVQLPELEELLARTGDEIRRLQAEKKDAERLKDSWDRSEPEMSSRLMRRLLALNGPSDPEWPSVRDQLELLHPRMPRDGIWICAAFAFADTADRDRWRDEAAAAAEGQGLSVFTAIVDGTGVACAALDSERHLEPAALWLNKLVGRGAGAGSAPKRAAGVGDPAGHPSQIGESFAQAMRALQYRFYRGWQSVLWSRELSFQDKADRLLFDKNHFIAFEEALRRQEFREAEERLDQAVNELLLYPSPDIDAVRKKLFRWYISMTKVYPEAMWEFENDELWSQVFVSGELYTIRQFMARRLQIIREGMQGVSPGDKSVIREVIRYVQQRYAEDISISSIAGHVYLTPTYLCLLFKKERGMSIHDFITQTRVDKAKQLLRDRSLKLYEIANRVGYQDANYFSKVFRKITGENPSEYRDRMEEPFI